MVRRMHKLGAINKIYNYVCKNTEKGKLRRLHDTLSHQTAKPSNVAIGNARMPPSIQVDTIEFKHTEKAQQAKWHQGCFAACHGDIH